MFSAGWNWLYDEYERKGKKASRFLLLQSKFTLWWIREMRGCHLDFYIISFFPFLKIEFMMNTRDGRATSRFLHFPWLRKENFAIACGSRILHDSREEEMSARISLLSADIASALPNFSIFSLGLGEECRSTNWKFFPSFWKERQTFGRMLFWRLVLIISSFNLEILTH